MTKQAAPNDDYDEDEMSDAEEAYDGWRRYWAKLGRAMPEFDALPEEGKNAWEAVADSLLGVPADLPDAAD